METILITISRGSIAKNLLDNDFYRILRERYRIVMLTPAHDDPRFLAQYAHPNVIMRSIEEPPFGLFDQILLFFHKHLIYNSTVNQKVRWGLIGDPRSRRPSYIGYLARRTLFTVLSRIRPLRDLVSFVDYRFAQKKEVAHFRKLLEDVQPRVVIATHITDDGEAALMKAARSLNIKTVGFLKSWDNLSKFGLRIKPDVLVVWNEFMKEQAIEFHNYAPENVIPVGVPQYDSNTDPFFTMTRDEFCAEYGLDPSRKIIVFGSEGKLFPSDATIAEIIAEQIETGAYTHPSQLLVRPHYGYKNDEQKFKSIIGKPNVVLDLNNFPSEKFRDAWDYSDAFTKRFINTMRHADVVINTASTLTLDAVCFDRPVVLIAFNDRKALPYAESVERWYETHYYRKILSYHAAPLVRSSAELQEAINTALDTPEKYHAERLRLRDDFTYRYDGKAGTRFAEVITGLVNPNAVS